MQTALTLRTVKQTAVSLSEEDANFTAIAATVDAAARAAAAKPSLQVGPLSASSEVAASPSAVIAYLTAALSVAFATPAPSPAPVPSPAPAPPPAISQPGVIAFTSQPFAFNGATLAFG